MATQLVGRPRVDFWMLSFGQLLIFCGFFSFFQFPLYIKAVGGAEEEIGIMMGVQALASTLLLPWITAVVARVERKGLMLGGIALLELATIACLATAAPDVLMATLMVARGLGFAVYMNASGTYVAQILPPGEKARWIGVNFGFNQVAIGLGPLVGELLIREVGFAFFFFFATVFCYAGMLLILPISRRLPDQPSEPFQPVRSLTVFFRELSGPRFRSAIITLLLMAGTLGAVFNFTATYTQLLGLSSGVFFLSYALTNAATRFFGAGLADRYGRTLIVIPTLALMGSGVLLFSFATGTPQMMAAAMLIGVGFGLSNPAILALMLDRAPPRLQGMAIGGFHFAYQLGLLSSAPMFGVVAERFGYPVMWWIAGAMALAAMGTYFLPARIPRIADEARAGAAARA